MKTYILMWNPAFSSYTKERFNNDLFDLIHDDDAYGVGNWSIWEYQEVEEGDRFFLVRVGKENTGIVMAGHFCSGPYEDEDWSGKNRPTFYADLDIDVQIDSDHVPVISTEQLMKELPGFDWTGGHSGRLLRKELAMGLEAVWCKYLHTLVSEEDNEHIFMK